MTSENIWYSEERNMHSDQMTSVSAEGALEALLEQTSANHQPLLIRGSKSNGVLLDEQEWNSLQETIYLLSIPGMRESIEEGLRTPIEECSPDPGW